MKDLFKEVSNIHGVSKKEVKNEISQALELAMQSNNDTAREFWSAFDQCDEISFEMILKAIIDKIHSD